MPGQEKESSRDQYLLKSRTRGQRSANHPGFETEKDLVSCINRGTAVRPSLRLLTITDSFGPTLPLNLRKMSSVNFVTDFPLENLQLFILFRDVTDKLRIRAIEEFSFTALVTSLNRSLALDITRVKRRIVNIRNPFEYRIRAILHADPFGELLFSEPQILRKFMNALSTCDNLYHLRPCPDRPLTMGEVRDGAELLRKKKL